MFNRSIFAVDMNMEKEHIILEKVRKLFMRYGIKSVTMDDVARALGISKKTLYQHVDNKSDLIQKMLFKHIEEEKNALQNIRSEAKNALEEMILIAKHVLQMFRELNPSVIYDLQKYYPESWDNLNQLHRTYLFEFIAQNIIAGKKEGLYKEGLNAAILARLYAGQMNIIIDQYFFPSKEFGIEEIYKEYINYHIRGIASREGLIMLDNYNTKD